MILFKVLLARTEIRLNGRSKKINYQIKTFEIIPLRVSYGERSLVS